MKDAQKNAEIAKLVVAAQAGKEAAFGSLVRATQDDLFRFLMFLVGNRQLAQDIAQDAYIKAIENLASLREPGAFLGWLFRLAKNLYLDHVRSPKNAEALDVQELVDLAAEPDQAEAMLEIRDLLEPLTPEDRYGFLLVYLQGYSYAEAATLVGISENAMRSRLHRARNNIDRKSVV